ncbi:MAG: acyltransferase [Pseudomonadota bacterium]|nr:acyltransferase [Pseudomonadota bacterium]
MNDALRISVRRDDLNALPPGNALPSAQVAPGYRTDVDGLRGIAVLSLLAVHLFPQLSRGGGLVGVDIFFVVSGFLISNTLFRAHNAGQFNLADFYGHRIERVVPSLCVVLLSCLVFSFLFAPPNELRQIGKHVVAAVLFISNFAMWREVGSAGLSSAGTPLFHLWALAFEVQFYLLWPIAVTCLVGCERRTMAVIGGLLALSFLLNLAFVDSNPNATFLLPPTRLWELMVGAMLACLSDPVRCGPMAWLRTTLAMGVHPWYPEFFAWAGVAMLSGAVLLIDNTQQFPGWWALLPTVGTFALLAAGPQASVNRLVLSHPILRFYGVISYPLYLWHWPLLSFPVSLGMPLTNELRVIILISSVVLAALTHELFEKPVRSSSPRAGWSLVMVAALLFTGLCGWAVLATGGLANTYPDSMRIGGR